jgi:hypothetical protein
VRTGKSVLIACLATFAITVGAGWLPAAIKGNGQSPKDVAVFRGAPPVHLSNANIVDVLAGLKLRERLGHAEWRNAVLSLELLVPSDGGRPEVWFGDVEKLIGISFIQLDNVSRLLVRIVEFGSGKKRLLAAVDVRENDVWLQEQRVLDITNPVHDEVWRQRLRLSFTTAWIERFGIPAGYSAHSRQQSKADIAN